MKRLSILPVLLLLATSCSSGQATESQQTNIDPAVAVTSEPETSEPVDSFAKADPSAEGLAAIFPDPALFGDEWILDGPVIEDKLQDGEFITQSDDPVPQPDEWACDNLYSPGYYGTFSEFNGTYSLNSENERTIVSITVMGATPEIATTIFDLDAFTAECIGEVSGVDIPTADSAIRYWIDDHEMMPNNETITVRKDDVVVTAFLADKTKLEEFDAIVGKIVQQIP